MSVWTSKKSDWIDPFKDVEFTPELREEIRKIFAEKIPEEDERLKAFDTKLTHIDNNRLIY